MHIARGTLIVPAQAELTDDSALKLQEEAHGPGAKLLNVLALFCGKSAQKVLGKQGDIVPSVSRKRKIDRDHVETVKKVFTEVAVFHLVEEFLIGCRDDPHIYRKGLFPS